MLVCLAAWSEEQAQDNLAFFSTPEDGYLEGFITQEFGGISAEQCAGRCRANECLSFTYSQQQDGTCALNSRRAGGEFELVQFQDYQYYSRFVLGCRDPAATNYNPAATVQDGNCLYGEGHWSVDTLNRTFENSYMLADMENALEVASGRSGCYPNPCSNVTGLNNETVQCIEMSDLEGFECEDCPAGFLGDGQVCTDEDDCTSRAGVVWDPCGVNTSYLHARAGNIGPAGADCRDSGLVAYECVCNDGFEWLGTAAPGRNESCTDIDDCGPRGIRGAGPCGEFAESCADEGTNSYSCICSLGYSWTDPLGACEEIFPCALGAHNCHNDSVCRHEGPGQYSCTCLPGYYGDGVTCTSFDACSASGLHPRLASRGNRSNLMLGDSVNRRSSTTRYGEFVQPSAMLIQDADPCWSTKEEWRVSCDDQPPPSWDFICGTCPDGYPGDGIQCTDIDECSDWVRNCGGHGICQDLAYEYRCDCDAGYSGAQCEVDVDECSTTSCGDNGACVDSQETAIAKYSQEVIDYIHSQHIRDLSGRTSLNAGEFSDEISIGFAFPFYGVDRHSLVINAAGFVAFVPTTTPVDCCASSSIPAAGYDALIAPYWTTGTATADVQYGTLTPLLYPRTDPFPDDSNRAAFAVSYVSVAAGTVISWRLALFWSGDFHIVLDECAGSVGNVSIGWQSGIVDGCGVQGGDGSSCASGVRHLTADCATRLHSGAFAALVPGESTIVDCPSNCDTELYSVWGHTSYRDDSSVCAAALHSTGQPGGQFIVYVVAEHPAQNSSFVHGVWTQSATAGSRAFAVNIAPDYGQSICTGSSCAFSSTLFHVRPDRRTPVDGFSCSCEAGFQGELCEIDTDECSSAPCVNGATCTESSNDATVRPDQYSCSCVAGFANGECEYDFVQQYVGDCTVHEGGNCDIDVDECISAPCQHDSVCVESSSSSSTTFDESTGRYVTSTVASTEVSYAAYRCLCRDGYSNGLCVYEFISEYQNECTVSESTASTETGNCDVDVDECLSEPCQNDAACSDSNTVVCDIHGCSSSPVSLSNFSCACNPGYTNGACAYDYIAEYTHLCTRNETGVCDVDLDECASEPCVNGGQCFDSTSDDTSILSDFLSDENVPIDAFTCFCPDGYANGVCNSTQYASEYIPMCARETGGRCDEDVDECASDPCSNDATCVSNTVDAALAVPGTFVCLCVPGFANGVCNFDNIDEYTAICNFHDRPCDVDMDECSSSPCVNDATCLDSTVLQEIDFDRYRCVCLAGFGNGICDYDYISEYEQQCTLSTGGFCDIDINECDSNPCLNSAVCEESTMIQNITVHTYQCQCGK
jgi:hypothetical protein